ALMIHNPWTWAAGNAQDFRKIADDLDKINEGIKSAYLEKCGDKIDEGTLTSLMDNESYITAKEAVEYGFADRIAESKITAAEALDKAVASVDRSNPFMAKKIDLISAKLKEQPEEKKISASAMEIFMSFFK
ncbi:MAG: ATP-dependent Clp protease proteolytic subunit, partial [Ruminococcus sp.]|nr:ATP-dependent Clp protease proteolytic subunit [Ruminococcus sp.]